ncbi:MAG: hypothetical protein KDK36_20140, partial [Leptospiraceae bacterium]|nr:hypothetical protein [Leptospiraceae bacterium]
SAGIVFNLIFLIGISIAYYWKDIDNVIYFPVFIGILFFTILGFIDDLKNLSSVTRLILEFAFLVILFYFVDFRLSIFGFSIKLHSISTLLYAFFALFLINITNFMDGLDFYLAGIFFTFILNLTFLFGLKNELLYIVLFTYFLSLLPYYYFNKPDAKLFMGDAGSLPIGFLFALLPIFKDEKFHNFDLAFSFILLPIFFSDAIYTLIKRTIAKKNILSAHREHLYQIVQDKLFTKRKTIFVFIFVNILPAFLFYIMKKKNSIPLGIFLAYALGIVIYFTIYFFYNRKNKKTLEEIETV